MATQQLVDSSRSSTSSPHFVLFPFMSKGHTIPILHLARLLLHRNSTITIFTTSLNAPFISEFLLNYINKNNNQLAIINLPFPKNLQEIPDGVESTDKLPSISLFLPFVTATKLMKPHFDEALKTLPNPNPITCIISDGFLGWTLHSAAMIGVPRLVYYGMSNYAMVLSGVLVRDRLLEGVTSDDEPFTVPPFPWIKLTRNDFDPAFHGNPDSKGPFYDFVMEHMIATANSKDAFKGFKDNNKQYFKESLCEDLKGMLSLYEASHFALEEGDDILDEAKIFTTRYLEGAKEKITNPILAQEVSKSLELPLHWRMLRLEARQRIEVSGSVTNRSSSEDNYISNSVLIEFAKLNFNVVQATHQEDLREASRWWEVLGLNSNPQLRFARDRLMENLLWTIGVIFEPQFSYCRKELTKVNSLITTIDDVYDVYGSLEELELFTHAVERWDLKAMDQLPNYMKICFLALYNTINEVAYVTMREQDCNILHYLKKGWADLCRAYLVEARWYYSKYTPTLEEYFDNAWISIAGPVMLVHTYFFVKQEITMEALKSLEKYPNIIRWSSMILRLCNDLGTSKDETERGDVPKSIQCYMHETGETEEVAREYMRNLIGETWKKMNKERVDYSIYSKPFIGTAVNLARMAQCMYQHGDGHGVEDGVTKNRVLSLLVEPMSLQSDSTH